MKLSTKTEYGLKALIHLAECGQGKPYSLKLIAQKEKLSFSFLEKIFQKLNKAGIVSSHRGVAGGYCLEKPLNEISVKNILDVLDGGVEVFGKMSDVQEGRSLHCKSHLMFSLVDRHIQDSLQKLNLADIIK